MTETGSKNTLNFKNTQFILVNIVIKIQFTFTQLIELKVSLQDLLKNNIIEALIIFLTRIIHA